MADEDEPVEDGPLRFDELHWYLPFLERMMAEKGLKQVDVVRRTGRAKGWVSMMLGGKRRLRPELVDEVATALHLDAEEHRELRARVEVCQSNSRDARARARHYLRGLAARRDAEVHADDVRNHMSTWYIGAVHELARCQGYRPDPAWIAATLFPPITAEQAQSAMEILQELGMLDESGEPTGVTPQMGTPSQLEGEHRAIVKIHRETVDALAASFDRFYPNERQITTGLFALTDEAWEELREQLHDVCINAALRANQRSTEPNRVYRLCIGLFPASLYTDTEYDPSHLPD
ncbi:MAG: TIGR02147 family protein [Myxococcota bacterium]